MFWVDRFINKKKLLLNHLSIFYFIFTIEFRIPDKEVWTNGRRCGARHLRAFYVSAWFAAEHGKSSLLTVEKTSRCNHWTHEYHKRYTRCIESTPSGFYILKIQFCLEHFVAVCAHLYVKKSRKYLIGHEWTFIFHVGIPEKI